MSYNELLKMGLYFGFSAFQNGVEIKDQDQILKQDDNFEIIIPNKKNVGKLSRLLQDRLDIFDSRFIRRYRDLFFLFLVLERNE